MGAPWQFQQRLVPMLLSLTALIGLTWHAECAREQAWDDVIITRAAGGLKEPRRARPCEEAGRRRRRLRRRGLLRKAHYHQCCQLHVK